MYLTVKDDSGIPQRIFICEDVPTSDTRFNDLRRLVRTLTKTSDGDVLFLRLVNFVGGKCNSEDSVIDGILIPFENLSNHQFEKCGVYEAYIPEGIPVNFSPTQEPIFCGKCACIQRSMSCDEQNELIPDNIPGRESQPNEDIVIDDAVSDDGE